MNQLLNDPIINSLGKVIFTNQMANYGTRSIVDVIARDSYDNNRAMGTGCFINAPINLV